ncbi:MAG: terminase family protein [Methanobrevibacter sp.]|nr:terminase family protein [Methanobrevibacter sp.]
MLIENKIPLTSRESGLLHKLLDETIAKNPYCKYKPYPKQLKPIVLANREEQYDEKGTKKPNAVLAGAGGYGGKTYLGSMLAVQYLHKDEDYTCLVTRRNYAELVDTNSIWDNLVDWCCGEHLPDDLICDFKQSPIPQIIAPNGNTIYFKAFDRDEKKQKFKSASYDRIVNDEASELPEAVLKFQYRSMRNTTQIPRSIINLSNPGGDSTEYLVKEFVDGPKPYVALDWRDNPFIDKAAYEGSLDELDYIDQQYQKYGNWHYRPTAGDLINRDQLVNAYIDVEDYIEREVYFCTMGIDTAGTGRDNTVAMNLIRLDNGLTVLNDMVIDGSAYPEDSIYNIAEKQITENNLYNIDFEEEPGGDSVYALRYWVDDILADLISKHGIDVTGVAAIKSKYTRARPIAKAIIKGQLKFSSHLKELLEKKDGLFDQFMYVSPNPEEMKKHKSPDELDALGYAWNSLLTNFDNTVELELIEL